MSRSTCAVSVIAAFVACGQHHAPPAPVGAPASIVATGASPDDAIVAEVNGRPVWGSCVATQAARNQLARDAALAQCIDFELLAQAAEQRGFATHREVVASTKGAMVNQLVSSVYESGYTRPEQFGGAWNDILAKTRLPLRWQHGEYRSSSYVRVELKKDATKEQDDQARAVAEKIAAAVAGERGLLGAHLVDIATPIAGSVPLFHQDVPLYKRTGLDPPYGEALYAIPEIGRASPAVRTAEGWDVIIWTGVEPETSPSPDELIEKMLPDVKRLYFNMWVGSVAQSLGIRPELVQENIAKLEELH